MKYIIIIVAIVLIPLALLIPRVLPVPENVGVIKVISESINVPLPHRQVVIGTKTGDIEVVMYDTAVNYKIGELVSTKHEGEIYVISEKYRLPSLLSLLLIFVSTVLMVSGVHGARSLMGLIFSFVVIFKFVLPQIIAGSNPIVIALLASIIILMVSYYLSHGINQKTTIAIIGTLCALIVTGLLASIYGNLAGLTGFGSEETGFLLDTLPKESFYKLLLAGIIIGSLGVLDDITISQTSIVEELKKANHRLGATELFVRAMRIGHDHIASLVNTLVLVYAGSALPLLLLFVVSGLGYSDLLSYEALSEEIVRTLVASIGLISAVPLTTLIASYWYSSKK